MNSQHPTKCLDPGLSSGPTSGQREASLHQCMHQQGFENISVGLITEERQFQNSCDISVHVLAGAESRGGIQGLESGSKWELKRREEKRREEKRREEKRREEKRREEKRREEKRREEKREGSEGT
ncbi:hypothetical protein HGM15179_016452 [Zosterops borbonicus]|uniref:Uncharacterized protein n=1 Tax=Zosterops borbonicus TaxID=364589 RepID=A0A8K1G328_9PASS|nr:hypothetical protein HGM15179_016452 [Zosterops borbonicus]